ncbi:hypothetical protein AnigIFM56816_001853 [Aspergillus niger]|nr:hypothetical protein AnigIFM56816_001853 [Aspergillus niger]
MPFTDPENEYSRNNNFSCPYYTDSGSGDNELDSAVGCENRFNAQGASIDQNKTQNGYDGGQSWAHQSSDAVDPFPNNFIFPNQFDILLEANNMDFFPSDDDPLFDSSFLVPTDGDLFEPRLQFGFHAFCKWKSSGLFSTTPAKANAVSEPGAKSCSVNKVVSLQFLSEELRISEGVE